MSLEVRKGIPGDDQECSFMNATLQPGPPGVEFSVAVHLDVPLIGVYDEDSLEAWLKTTLGPIIHDKRVHIEVEMGPARED